MKRHALADEQWVPRRQRPLRVTGDKAYSNHRVRNWLHAHGIGPVIPHKTNERTPRQPRQV